LGKLVASLFKVDFYSENEGYIFVKKVGKFYNTTRRDDPLDGILQQGSKYNLPESDLFGIRVTSRNNYIDTI
jgi:hypothetical protein